MNQPKPTARVAGQQPIVPTIPAPLEADSIVDMKDPCVEILDKAAADATKRSVQVILNEINRTWSSLVSTIVKTGGLLRELKSATQHGEWLKHVEEDLPFDIRTAQRLMEISRHPVLSNAAMASRLPPKWSVLAEMISIPEQRLELAIRQGVIHPEIKREELRSLRWLTRPKGDGSRVAMLQEPPPEPCVGDVAHARGVICVMAGICRVEASDIMAETRLSPRIAFARQMVYYCLSTQNDWDATRVGRAITRDRTTVEHGRIVIEDMRDDPHFDAWLERACDILAAAQNLADTAPERVKD